MSKTAWVVHSEESWREGIADVLAQHGFTVIEKLLSKNEAVAKLTQDTKPDFISSDALGDPDEIPLEKLAEKLSGQGIGHVILSLASTRPIEESLTKYSHYTTVRFMRKGSVEFLPEAFDVERFIALAEESIAAALEEKRA